MYLTVIFVRTEDFVQAVGAKSRYFPPMSLVVGNLRFTRIIRKLDNPRMDNRESTVLSAVVFPSVAPKEQEFKGHDACF